MPVQTATRRELVKKMKRHAPLTSLEIHTSKKRPKLFASSFSNPSRWLIVYWFARRREDELSEFSQDFRLIMSCSGLYLHWGQDSPTAVCVFDIAVHTCRDYALVVIEMNWIGSAGIYMISSIEV